MDRDKRQDQTPDQSPDRLEGLAQSELGESKYNEEFIQWLKTTGPNVLLGVLILLCAIIGFIRWRDYQDNQRQQAWAALLSTDMPRSFVDVAEKYGKIDSVGALAYLNAGQRLLQSVQTGRQLGAESPAPADPADPEASPDTTADAVLTDDLRTEYLAQAEGYFNQALEAGRDGPATVLLRVAAYEGLAAVEEARANLDAAREQYQSAADLAAPRYPAKAAQLKERMADLERLVNVPVEPEATEEPVPADGDGDTTRVRVRIDRNLEPLIFPGDDAESPAP
jgi:tetratricopeptide (TPR) repeat protein